MLFMDILSMYKKIILFFILASWNGINVEARQVDVGSITASSRNVIRRTIGNRADAIDLQVVPSENGTDVYEIEARGGVLTVRGSSPSAICSGFYEYLRKACKSMVSWSGSNLHIPLKWPDYSKVKVVSPYRYRYYLNVVTFGYTTPYWDWARWEKELDWMALHGVNLPLATVASETIAARVWKKLGLSNKETDAFFTGPAHLPWHRMGNLNKWDGPVPSDWHKDQLDLQHKILKRMRELGMNPVAPAFAGFVPEGFKKKHPELHVNALKWGGFPAEYNAYVLSPGSPWFKTIGKMFVEEWEKEFGKNTFYLSDSFNEMDVPVPKDHPEQKYPLLAGYGESIYNSIKAGNPDAVWVTQGWTFGYQHKFWDQRSLQAMLSKVPDDRMLILDLANEYPEYVWKIPMVWKTHQGFYGKQWIYSFVPNFGGKTPWTGVLSLYASGSAEALKSPFSKNLVGFGSAPEGIENNEVVYELLADMGWKRDAVDLDKWLDEYCRSRYGAYPDKMKLAWEQLRKSAYGSFGSYPRFLWQLVVPDTRRKGSVNSDSLFMRSAENFLDCSEELKASKLYQNDAIEIAMLYLGVRADQWYSRALKADAQNDQTVKRKAGEKAVEILYQIDRLLESHPNNRLQTWVDYARSHGKTEEEKNYYEANAKRLITTWGGVQNDYAARIWSGLIRDYYIPRIQKHLANAGFRRLDWEEKWIKTPGGSRVEPFDDPIQKAKELVAAYGSIEL